MNMQNKTTADLSWLPPALRGDPGKPVLLACGYAHHGNIVMISIAPGDLIKARSALQRLIADNGIDATSIQIRNDSICTDADFKGKLVGGNLQISEREILCKFYCDTPFRIARYAEFCFSINDALPVVEFCDELNDVAYFGVNDDSEVRELYVLKLNGRSPGVALKNTTMNDIKTISIEDAPSEVVKQLVEMGCVVDGEVAVASLGG